MSTGTFASQADSLVKVQPTNNKVVVDGYWATKSGGEVSADVSPVWDGGARYPEQLAGRATTSDVTVSRPYKRGRDDRLRAALLPLVGSGRFTVSDQGVDADGIPVGKPEVYANALLRQVNGMEVDASGSDPKTLELVFAVSRTA